METKFLDILNKWAIYSNYDRTKNSFNLNSYEYEFHKVNKKIEYILKNYDETGVLAILSAKNMFIEFIKDAKVKLFDILSNPEDIQRDVEMFQLFYSNLVTEAEDYYFNMIENLSLKIIGKKLIGKENSSKHKEFLFSCTDIVIDNLDKCRLDVYKKGGEITDIKKISTYIKVFPSLASCLIALDEAEDGMYLCYIDINSSPDSYFGFFIKNNGNIFSVSEIINEKYKGSHQHSRNGRWTEGKADGIFPYDFIFSYDKYDYKGYASNYKIDEEKLSFSQLTEDVYTPILLSMIMIIKKYQGKVLTEEPIQYVDSLLPINLKLISSNKNELAVIEKSALVESHKNLNLSFDVKKVLDGTYNKEFTNEELNYDEKMSTLNQGQYFIDLWGEGFTFDINSLYEIPNQKLLEDNQESYSVEFVGSEHRQRLQGYYVLRKQLTSYIRNQMKKEFEEKGGKKYYKEWFINCIKNNIKKLEMIMVEKYIDIKNGGRNLSVGWSTSDVNILTDIYYIEESYPSGFYDSIWMNQRDVYKSVTYDERTGSKCCMYFAFKPKNYKALEELFGEVPKLVKGWNANNHYCSGNTILDLTDNVESVGTPFEEKESKFYYNDYSHNEKPYMNFSFIFGFSKRGFKQMAKELNISLK